MSMIEQIQKTGQKTGICPHSDCNTLAQQVYVVPTPHYTPDRTAKIYGEIEATRCAKCKKMAYWIEGIQVYPSNKTYLPVANRDMPANIKEIYQEAANIFGVSPRAATALLRLGIKKLSAQLGPKGDNISTQVEALIKEELPLEINPEINQSTNLINEVLLPETLSTIDNRRIAKSLFMTLNTIVEKAVSEQKMLNDGYNYLARRR
ncbi:MAG: hypothetical protein V7750_01560 [Sneathiella sp.]